MVEISVLNEGLEEKRSVDGGTTVVQLITDLLPDDQKARADDYMLATGDGAILDPDSRLADDGIADGAVLALTKKDGGGGGGACSRP